MSTTDSIPPRFCPRCGQNTSHSQSVSSIEPGEKEVRRICNRCGGLTTTQVKKTDESSSAVGGDLPREAEKQLEVFENSSENSSQQEGGLPS